MEQHNGLGQHTIVAVLAAHRLESYELAGQYMIVGVSVGRRLVAPNTGVGAWEAHTSALIAGSTVDNGRLEPSDGPFGDTVERHFASLDNVPIVVAHAQMVVKEPALQRRN